MAPEEFENIFKWLEQNKGKRIPFKYKYMLGEPLEPEDLYIKGNLDFSNDMWLESLPDNLHVDGNLNLTYTKLKEIPNNLYVKGALFLMDTPLMTNLNKDNKKLREEIEFISDLIKDKGGFIGRGAYRTNRD